MHCTTCDSFVTADFVRVFGTNDGQVFACPSCASMTDVTDGAAVERPMGDTRANGESG